MRYDLAKHHRRSLRLGGYNYAQANAYFVALTVQSRRNVFARASGGTVVLNEAGRALEATWHTLPEHLPTISLDAFTIMPNHAHMIIILNPTHPVRAPLVGARSTVGPGRTLTKLRLHLHRIESGEMALRSQFL